jgi:hypothetical protein
MERVTKIVSVHLENGAIGIHDDVREFQAWANGMEDRDGNGLYTVELYYGDWSFPTVFVDALRFEVASDDKHSVSL